MVIYLKLINYFYQIVHFELKYNQHSFLVHLHVDWLPCLYEIETGD